MRRARDAQAAKPEASGPATAGSPTIWPPTWPWSRAEQPALPKTPPLPHRGTSLHRRSGLPPPPALRDPRPFLALGPGGRQARRDRRRSKLWRRTAPTEAISTRYLRRDQRPTSSQPGSTSSSASAGPGGGWTRTAPPPPRGSPSTWEPSPGEMRAPGLRYGPLLSQRWMGLSPAEVADNRCSETTPSTIRKPATPASRDPETAEPSARRHGCTPSERRSCWPARRCGQS